MFTAAWTSVLVFPLRSQPWVQQVGEHVEHRSPVVRKGPPPRRIFVHDVGGFGKHVIRDPRVAVVGRVVLDMPLAGGGGLSAPSRVDHGARHGDDPFSEHAQVLGELADRLHCARQPRGGDESHQEPLPPAQGIHGPHHPDPEGGEQEPFPRQARALTPRDVFPRRGGAHGIEGRGQRPSDEQFRPGVCEAEPARRAGQVVGPELRIVRPAEAGVVPRVDVAVDAQGSEGQRADHDALRLAQPPQPREHAVGRFVQAREGGVVHPRDEAPENDRDRPPARRPGPDRADEEGGVGEGGDGVAPLAADRQLVEGPEAFGDGRRVSARNPCIGVCTGHVEFYGHFTRPLRRERQGPRPLPFA